METKLLLHTAGLEGLCDLIEYDVGKEGERRQAVRSAYSEPLSELLARVKLSAANEGETIKLLVPEKSAGIRARENKRRGGLTVLQVVEESGIPFEVAG